MSPTTADYRNLQIIGGIADGADGGFVRGADLAEHRGISIQQAYRILSRLAHPEWDGGHPWIERVTGGVILTLDGRGVYMGIRRNPYLCGHKERAWINRMRWPWLRKDSRTRAVIPRGGNGKRTHLSPMWRQSRRRLARPAKP